MSTVRSFWRTTGLVGVLILGGLDTAEALPASFVGNTRAFVHHAAMVCGPDRCFARPFWRYGPGVGFQRFQRFDAAPRRPFGYRPFGFGRFGGQRFNGRRW